MDERCVQRQGQQDQAHDKEDGLELAGRVVWRHGLTCHVERFCIPRATATPESFEPSEKEAPHSPEEVVVFRCISLQSLHTTTEGDTVGEGSFVQFVGFVLDGTTEARRA